MRSIIILKMLKPGDTLKNQYQIRSQLGSAGGFGITFLAEDTFLPSRRACAIKEIDLPPSPNQRTLIEWCNKEARLLERLGRESAQIPSLYAFFEDNGNFYLVQEFIDGITLSNRLSKNGVFSENQAIDFLAALLPVLEFVHADGVIHRDIKPDNIMVRHVDAKPVLIDFGTVKELSTIVVDKDGNLVTTLIPGTPSYASPEQKLGKEPTFASDIYSLGMTVVNLLTGKSPASIVSASNSVEWARHVSPRASKTFASLLDKALHFEPSRRFQTAREMLLSVESLKSSGDSTTVPQRNKMPPKKEPIKKEPIKIEESDVPIGLLVFVGTFLGAIVAGGLYWALAGLRYGLEVEGAMYFASYQELSRRTLTITGLVTIASVTVFSVFVSAFLNEPLREKVGWFFLIASFLGTLALVFEFQAFYFHFL